MNAEVRTHDVERRTVKVDEALTEVLVGSDTDLVTVARAVRDLNETLAVHAAWTEERFEAVNDRLVSLARIQVMASGKVETQIAGIDARLLGFGVSQPGSCTALARLEQKAERLERGQEVLQQGLAALVETMHGLTARVGEVLASAISGEMEQHVTGPQQPD